MEFDKGNYLHKKKFINKVYRKGKQMQNVLYFNLKTLHIYYISCIIITLKNKNKKYIFILFRSSFLFFFFFCI
jgi:hypothetical protein